MLFGCDASNSTYVTVSLWTQVCHDVIRTGSHGNLAHAVLCRSIRGGTIGRDSCTPAAATLPQAGVQRHLKIGITVVRARCFCVQVGMVLFLRGFQIANLAKGQAAYVAHLCIVMRQLGLAPSLLLQLLMSEWQKALVRTAAVAVSQVPHCHRCMDDQHVFWGFQGTPVGAHAHHGFPASHGNRLPPTSRTVCGRLRK